MPAPASAGGNVMASLSQPHWPLEADEAGPGAGRQLQANTSLQWVPSTRPRLIITSDTVGTVASDSEGPQSDTLRISRHAKGCFCDLN